MLIFIISSSKLTKDVYKRQLVGSMLAVALILNPLIVFLCIRQNPYPLVFKCIKESGITAFFTRSSAANIPVNMQLCKSLDLDEDNYSVPIPLGATINMEGAAITISIMTLAATNTLGIDVDLPTDVYKRQPPYFLITSIIYSP